MEATHKLNFHPGHAGWRRSGYCMVAVMVARPGKSARIQICASELYASHIAPPHITRAFWENVPFQLINVPLQNCSDSSVLKYANLN